MCEDARQLFVQDYWQQSRFHKELEELAYRQSAPSPYESHIGLYRLGARFEEAISMSWSGMPGCQCEVVISHNVYIEPALRGKGLGQFFLLMRMRAWKGAEYKMAIATVRDDNVAEKHLLEKHGWKLAPEAQFPGMNTGSTVSMYVVNLLEAK